MDAKYAGKRTVMQQGAKRAATPAKNDAVKDAPTNGPINIKSYELISALLKRSALKTTIIELADIRRAAHSGRSNIPKA